MQRMQKSRRRLNNIVGVSDSEKAAMRLKIIENKIENIERARKNRV
jgi:hypothetical protein